MRPRIKGGEFPVRVKREHDLANDIEALRTGSFEIDPKLTSEKMQALTERFRQPMKGGEEYDQLKKEREEALAALKIEQGARATLVMTPVWHDPAFRKERKDILASGAGLEEGTERISQIYAQRVRGWIEKQRLPKARLRSFMRRFDELVSFRADITDNYLTVPLLIEGGIGTAREAAYNLAKIVIDRFAELKKQGVKFSKKQVLEAVDRAYTAIGFPLAMMHLDTSITFMQGLWENPSFFELRSKDKDGYRLYLNPDKLGEIRGALGTPVFEILTAGKVTFCPGMYAVGNRGAVIPDFFDYSLKQVKASPEFKALG